jgi:hypothetical protein
VAVEDVEEIHLLAVCEVGARKMEEPVELQLALKR